VASSLRAQPTPQHFFHFKIIISVLGEQKNRMEAFARRIMHARNFRAAEEFSGKHAMVVGTSYLAEDIANHCHKYGVKSMAFLNHWMNLSENDSKYPHAPAELNSPLALAPQLRPAISLKCM
jgi:hypothetical protein